MPQLLFVNQACPCSYAQTLVLKVEKEREDALAQVKKLTEQNAELQEVRPSLHKL